MGAIIDRFFVERGNAVLVVIDIQEKLCLAMDPEELARLKKNTGILIAAAAELGVPVLATEQYTRGLGETVPELRSCLESPALEKMSFSCCGDPAFVDAVGRTGRRQVVVVGMETHVCVLQTVLELLDGGYTVHVVADAVMSRSRENRKTGLRVARHAGAVISSTEAVLFQLLRVAGTEEFKKLSKLVK